MLERLIGALDHPAGLGGVAAHAGVLEPIAAQPSTWPTFLRAFDRE